VNPRVFSFLLGLGAISIAACTQVTDVVAVAREPGEDPTAPSTSAMPVPDPFAEPVPGCGPFASLIAVRTKTGELYRVDANSKTVVGGGKVDCLGPSPEPLATSRDGTVWATNGGKLVAFEPGSFACKTLPVNLSTTAMAFVADPKSGRESLYAVVEDVLIVLDPLSLLRSPIGKMPLADLRGLAGTADGRLLAFSGGTPNIWEIGLGDASATAVWDTKSFDVGGERLVGGAVVEQGLELFVGASTYLFDPRTQSVVSRAILFSSDPGVLAVSGAPCSILTK
jgi:hypothetical protein